MDVGEYDRGIKHACKLLIERWGMDAIAVQILSECDLEAAGDVLLEQAVSEQMQSVIDDMRAESNRFTELTGPFVVWFDGEGRDSIYCETPAQVVEMLMSDQGAAWSIDGSTEEMLMDHLSNHNNWTLDESGRLFRWWLDLGEISTVNVLAIYGNFMEWKESANAYIQTAKEDSN